MNFLLRIRIKNGVSRMAATALIIPAVIAAGCRGVPDQKAQEDGKIATELGQVTAAVHAAGPGLGALSSRPDFIKLVRKFIAPVRFLEDGSGYFFVYNTDGIVIAHAANKDLVGKNLYSLRDKTGKYFIQDKIKTAESGGGYVTYYWPEPKTKKVKLKKVYVEMIPGTDYLIGSGVYYQ